MRVWLIPLMRKYWDIYSTVLWSNLMLLRNLTDEVDENVLDQTFGEFGTMEKVGQCSRPWDVYNLFRLKKWRTLRSSTTTSVPARWQRLNLGITRSLVKREIIRFSNFYITCIFRWSGHWCAAGKTTAEKGWTRRSRWLWWPGRRFWWRIWWKRWWKRRIWRRKRWRWGWQHWLQARGLGLPEPKVSIWFHLFCSLGTAVGFTLSYVSLIFLFS